MNGIPPTEWSARLEHRTRGATVPLHPEDVHELRVACGRLLVWLDLGGWRVLRDDLIWLRRSAATVRDLDVVLERFAERPWAKDLGAQRELAAGGLRGVLASGRAQAVSQTLAVMPPAGEQTASRALARLARRAERAGDRLQRSGEDLAGVHRLRRAVRRLRYGLEWIDDSPAELVRLQTDLGLINDLAITDRVLADCAGDDGVQVDRDSIANELRVRCDGVRDAWKQARRAVGSR